MRYQLMKQNIITNSTHQLIILKFFSCHFLTSVCNKLSSHTWSGDHTSSSILATPSLADSILKWCAAVKKSIDSVTSPACFDISSVFNCGIASDIILQKQTDSCKNATMLSFSSNRLYSASSFSHCWVKERPSPRSGIMKMLRSKATKYSICNEKCVIRYRL